MADFYVSQGDLTPPIQTTLLAADGKTPQDLTNCTLVFRFQRADRTGVVREAAASIITPTGGVVRYDWNAGDTAAPGLYSCEWIVTFPGGKPGTWPSRAYNTLEIKPRLIAA